MSIWLLGLAVILATHVGWSWSRPVGTPLRDEALDLPAKPMVSVIVPSWNDDDVLARCIESVGRSIRHYEGLAEVIVVSGGIHFDADITRSVIDRLINPIPWTLVPQTPGGKNAALNQGIGEAHGDILVFVDADTVVEPDWLFRLVQPIARGDKDAVTANFSAFVISRVTRLYLMAQVYNQEILGRVSLFGGGTIAMSRSVLNALGGLLDESIWVGVDWHLSEQIKSHGFRVGFVPGARVTTEISTTWMEHCKNEARWRRAYWWNQLRLFRSEKALNRLVGVVYVPAVGVYILCGTVLVPLAYLENWLPSIGLVIWCIGWGWVVLRYLAQSVLVYRYSRNVAWLSLIPYLVPDLYLGLLATWVGILSGTKLDRHFKGRRAPKAISS